MNRPLPLILACVLTAVSSVALAQDSADRRPDREEKEKQEKSASEKERESVTYSGIGIAAASTDFDNLKDAVNLSAAIGFRIPTQRIFSVELEIATTIIPGENSGAPPLLGGGGGDNGGLPIVGGGGGGGDGGGGNGDGQRLTRTGNDLQMNNIGIYLVARSPGRFYAMGKYGYGYTNNNIPELQEKRSDTAYGAGLGYRWNPDTLSGVELYYTRFNDEIDYAGFQISYGFGGLN
jgi:hypothetical protein